VNSVVSTEGVQRLAVGIEYDGTGYSGWQRQTDAPTIQEEVEKALSSIANHPVEVVSAGRTDAGVHALGQVFHFDVQTQRPFHGWLLGANTRLPDAIALQWVRAVSSDFHARFSATSRRYRYVIFQSRVRPALQRHQACWYRYPLDITLMQQGSRALLGEHDFTSFRAAGCQSHTPYRFIHSIEVSRHEEWVYVDIEANAFLHHMVRNIVGVLLEIGGRREEPSWAKEVLEARDRRKGGVTAPAEGLYFVEAVFPESFQLPRQKMRPSFRQ
jgi:tRNA pseudouridine38-40 synthase